MASSEHKNLATFIKGIHNHLRKESQVHGAEEAWQRHVTQRDTLQKYAVSMQELATKHWAENVADSTKTTKCRITWVITQCSEYFRNGKKELYYEREMSIKQKMMPTERTDDIYAPSKTENARKLDQDDAESNVSQSGTKYSRSHSEEVVKEDGSKRLRRSNDYEEMSQKCGIGNALNLGGTDEFKKSSRIKLLDAGSCYNPFGDVECFDVTAIDLAPFCDEVFQCDFLSVKEGKENMVSENPKQVLQLAVNYFDTVVFCLLLEYLPSPRQRYACCAKAYNLLNNGGLLLIITPDSKHVGANAKIMKSWRFVLARLGFMRIKYEKLPHAHCLAFRKCVHKEVANRWVDLQIFPRDDVLFRSGNKMFIPQDFRESVIDEEDKEENSDCRENVADIFKELPCTYNISDE